ncbi:unnamed protein product [Closterium sp. NIES-54]
MTSAPPVSPRARRGGAGGGGGAAGVQRAVPVPGRAAGAAGLRHVPRRAPGAREARTRKRRQGAPGIKPLGLECLDLIPLLPFPRVAWVRQDRVRSGEASSEEYFELGAIMLRKKFFVVANKYLELAIAKWEGDEQELAQARLSALLLTCCTPCPLPCRSASPPCCPDPAFPPPLLCGMWWEQVYNALGFSYFSEEKLKEAVKAYEKAVSLQPAYVTAWNNLGDALERQKEWARALKAYDTALVYDPSNRIAVGRAKDLRQRVERLRY